MKHFSDVTLVCIDCVDIARAIKSIEKSLEQCSFEKVKLFTSIDTDYKYAIKIPTINSKIDYSIFCVKELHKHIDTKYMLVVQHDGWIVDGTKWKDEFGDYDFVGGIVGWRNANGDKMDGGHKGKGGCGGFSWRSKAMMKAASEVIPIEHCHPEDVTISSAFKGDMVNGMIMHGYRTELEERGFKFAPVTLEKYFCIDAGKYNGHFGCHRPLNDLPSKEIPIDVKYKLTILIAAGRPENLITIIDNIESERPFNYFNFSVKIIIDKPCSMIDKKIIDYVTSRKYIQLSFIHYDNNFGGFASKNTLFDMVDDGYMYILDDDNILYPKFFERIHSYMCQKLVGAYFFSQKNKITVNKNFVVRPNLVDTAMCVFDKESLGDLKYEIKCAADGVLFQRMFNNNPQNALFIEETLCYFNRLRGG